MSLWLIHPSKASFGEFVTLQDAAILLTNSQKGLRPISDIVSY